ncbi:mitotic checkpoint protein BUB3.3-like [Mangifera indica]|uniref:mitotic checkpoint protein BUB3.3-like n=1 Tax=Mangifera indica TaxID=29780 RepID=UPI001CFA16BB|nr:mitotic checkpoint protein BUB3.3-like [Mangifera indica]
MNGVSLDFENQIGDAISRIRFAPNSNNLLISSWDTCLRLYDVDSSLVRLVSPTEAALLDCCFQKDHGAFSVGSDGSIRRCDLNSGMHDTIGYHDDIATCLQYSDESGQLLTAGLDKKIMSWDTRMGMSLAYQRNLGGEVDSMSLSGFELIVAIGASVNIYDLRNLDSLVLSNESLMDAQIKCVSSIPYARGYIVGSTDGRVAVGISDPSDSNNSGYTFRCHPKSKNGIYHVVSVNDIVFNPFIDDLFFTGDNEGYVIAWDAKNKRRLFELPEFPNSVASLSCNHGGELLAVASSYTYQEAIENVQFASAREEPPQIFIHKMDVDHLRSASVRRIMSDEEHHFESKADAGASKTYPQQAGTIRKNGYIVIKNRPCKVVEVSTSKTGKHGHAKCHFVGIDIFNGKKLEDIVPSSHNCDVPHVNRTDYQLIDISEDGFVSLLTENGNTKDDLRLPTDDSLLAQIKSGFEEGKDLVVSVMSAMGEEQICALKDIGPKN